MSSSVNNKSVCLNYLKLCFILQLRNKFIQDNLEETEISTQHPVFYYAFNHCNFHLSEILYDKQKYIRGMLLQLLYFTIVILN